MKTKSIIGLLVFCMTLGMLTTSCEDMLTPDSERHSYEVANDTLYSYWGILKSLQNVAERYVILNECRADLVDGTSNVSDTIAAILNFGQNGYGDKYQDGACKYLRISDYYHVINSCNAYIAHCDTFRTTGTDRKYMIREYSQVQAIRAWVYMQLVYAYGEVPFYTEPLLTTDAINKMANNPNRQMANASNLVDLLGKDLISMEYVERSYGFPFYNRYGDTDEGNSNFVCHSSKVMFPVSLVLGDLYLMKGDQASCREAARHYYNFLNAKNGGPLPVTFYSTANVTEGMDEPEYNYNRSPFAEKSEFSRLQESITCIPSNKGKLDGNVNTDICRLFGFEPKTSTSGAGDDVSSNVNLTLNFERQLVASQGYEALCDSQQYEIYIGDNNNPFLSLEVMPGVGDARRAWTMDPSTGRPYTGFMGEDRVYGKFVSKQNPGRSFSTVYPVVYRRSMVWLHYAEALNRAGYPSYAFAILKNGLCQNDYWYPSEEDYDPTEVVYRWINTNDTLDVDTIPAQRDSNGAYLSAENLKKAVLDTYLALGIDSADIASCGVVDSFVVNRKNYSSYYDKACYYLDYRELKKAKTESFLNFDAYYLEGNTSAMSIIYKSSMYSRNTNMTSYPTNSISDFYLTMGIHQHGCGKIRYDERAQSGKESVYNYVDQVAKKIKENHGVIVTKDDIYGDEMRDWVIEAVEDLIVDEGALELAFEGSRFSDLARVSLRRNDPTYLAKHVAKRGGTMDMGLYNFLSQSPKNWYLPFPVE